MRQKTIAAEISGTLQALLNCQRGTGLHEWEARHEQRLEWLARNWLPSGSGIDTGTKISMGRSKPGRLVLTSSYHRMNEVGMYDGWFDFRVIVTPEFDGMDIRIIGLRGAGADDLRDYLTQIYMMELGEIFPGYPDGV